jgi:3-hydroxyisobutyrate dehydrogenase-like beta-hydroxyacid dehydrogenase
MLKDLENASAVAKEKGVPLPMSSTAVQLYRMLAAHGKAQQEISTIIELLAGDRK